MSNSDDFEQLSPLVDDCRQYGEMTLARLSAMAGADDIGRVQKAYIEALGETMQLSLAYLDALSRVAESLARKLNQVN